MKKIIIILLILLSTGCFDRREVKDLAVANSVMFDYRDGKVVYMVELVNAKAESVGAQGSTQYVPYLYVKGTGKEILDATSDCTLSVSKMMYYAHMKVIFLSESFLREKGEIPVLDLMSRFTETRQNSYIVVIKDEDMDDFYNATTSYSDFFGDFVEDNRKGQRLRLWESVYTTSLEAIKDHYFEGKHGVLGVLDVVDLGEGEVNNPIATSYDKTKNNKKVKSVGAAVLKEGKLHAFLDGDETTMYNYIKGDIRQLNLIVENNSFTVKGSKVDVKTKIDKNKQVTIDVNINLSTTVIMSEATDNFSNYETLKRLQDKINSKLEKELKAFLDKSQNDIEVDFLGFGTYFHIQNPKEWKEIKKDWDQYFKKAIINVKVNSAIISSGKMTESFKKGG